MRYGLIGMPLGHSFSRLVHNELGGYDYRLYPLEEDELDAFLAQEDLGGLNVTIPYKRRVMGACTALSPEAEAIGCVNTLVRRPDQSWYGHNTDCDGFLALARSIGLTCAGKKALVLGSGATSLTVSHALRRLGATEVVIISRSGENNYQNLDRHRDAAVIVNTTPVGMFPKSGDAPLSLDGFDACRGLLDVVYNPLRTRLVLEAQARGIPAAGGLTMLVMQAAAASALFTGRVLPQEEADALCHRLRRQLESLVLIGMPGCGKTAVGQALAQLTGREFFDTDRMVEDWAGCSIPELFARQGEAAFRALERRAVAEAAARSGCIIATGGGAPLDAQNRMALAQNGRLVLLTRDLSLLPCDGRPLSVDLEALARVRMPVYRAAADLVIENNADPARVAAAIWEAHHEAADS